MNRMFFTILALITGTCLVTATFAQVPDTYTNLKLLPKDIKRPELTEKMRSFNKALGVKCNFCHVGEEGQPLSTYDFASDKNKHKVITRTMMKMVQDVNTNYLKSLSSEDEKVTITCNTCHQGNKYPPKD